MKYLKIWHFTVQSGVPLLFLSLSDKVEYKAFLETKGPNWNRFINLLGKRPFSSVVFVRDKHLDCVALLCPKER